MRTRDWRRTQRNGNDDARQVQLDTRQSHQGRAAVEGQLLVERLEGGVVSHEVQALCACEEKPEDTCGGSSLARRHAYSSLFYRANHPHTRHDGGRVIARARERGRRAPTKRTSSDREDRRYPERKRRMMREREREGGMLDSVRSG